MTLLQLMSNGTTLWKRTLSLVLATLACLAATSAFAQPTQSADWRQSITSGTGASLARSPNGDYVSLGLESPNSVDARYGANLVLQRYRYDGQPVWPTPVRRATLYPGIRPYGVTTDAVGNIFVLATEGDYNYTLCAQGTTCGPPPPLTMFDAYWIILKHAPDGTFLWQSRLLDVSTAPIQAVSDSAGDLFVLFDAGGRTAPLAKLSGATGATLWSTRLLDQSKPGGIALTPSGTVVVAASGTFFGISINEFAQDTGTRLTRTSYIESTGYYAPGLAVGPQGDIVVTGYSANGLFLALETAARQTVFTTSTATPGAQGKYVAFDDLGRIVVAGTVPGATGTDWLVTRHDTVGALVHAPVVVNRHASAAETPLALVTAGDAAYVTGAAGPAVGSDPNSMQAVTMRLAANGNIDWVASEAAGARIVGAAVASDGSVTVLTAGGMSLVHYNVAPTNRAPISAISVASVAGLQVNLNASASTDPDGVVASYQWNFGDGASLVTTTPTVSHVYPASGGYTVTVVAVDNLGLAGSAASASVSVVAPPTPTALSLSATAVRGGNSVTGRVTLTTNAGAVVTLTSSNPAVAAVPSTVTVPAGSSSASFTIRTYRVRSDTAVTITAAANGKSASKSLTVKR